MRAARACLAGGLALLIAASACGFQERKQQAEFMIRTPLRLRDARSARAAIGFAVQQTVDQRSLQLPGATVPPALQQQLRRAQQAPQAQAVAPASVDFAAGRAAIVVSAPEIGEIPVAVWDKTSLFMVRGGRGAKRRPWVQLDFAHVARRKGLATTPPANVSGLSPIVLTDLLAGALAGSVKRMASVDLGGVATTRYRLNLDWDKALSDQGREAAKLPKLSKRRVNALQRVYEQMAISDTIFPSQVWLDKDGLPRRLVVMVKQTALVQAGGRRRHLRFLTTMRLDLSDFGTPTDIVVPDKKDLIRVSGFGELYGEIQASATQAAATPAPGAAAGPGASASPQLPPDIARRLGR